MPLVNGASRASALETLLVFLGLAVAGCGGSQPLLPSPETTVGPPAPRLISPINDSVGGRQNDPSSGCPATDPSRGAGLTITFGWEPVPGAVAYLGCYWRDGTEAQRCVGRQYPYLWGSGAFHTAETQATVVSCGFIAEPNLGDWHWTVAARTAASGWGPFSPPATFGFTPCRLADGGPCFAR